LSCDGIFLEFGYFVAANDGKGQKEAAGLARGIDRETCSVLK